MSTAKFLAAHYSADHAAAVAYWASRELKKYAVHVVLGSGSRPKSETITYVQACTPERAIEGARRAQVRPGLVSYHARLAGPAELACVPMRTTS